MTDRIVVTGLGCVSPLGDVDDMWPALVAGRSGIGRITGFDVSSYRTKFAGEARDFDPNLFMSSRDIQRTSRCVQLAVRAAESALRRSALDVHATNVRRVGVYFGTSIGPLALAISHHATFLEKGIGRVHPLAPSQDYPGVVASEIAIRFGVQGPAMTVTTACTSGADAIGFALSQLRSGAVDIAIAGASEAPLFPLLFAGFDRLGLMSRRSDDPARACRPFSADRDGIILSEGAAACILESETSARRRNVQPLAEVAGFAATCDAHHHLLQLPSGSEAAHAMEIALEDAATNRDQVDYVNAHGTGTVPNDSIETLAIKTALGDRARVVPVSSIKSMTGHLMGTSGALEFLACVKALETGIIPPTINLEVRDPACDLDYVPNEAREARLGTIVSNTFGFGSRNAALVIKSIR